MDFFDFTESEYERISKECMLNKEYKTIFEMKIKQYRRWEIAQKIGVSEPTLDKMIKNLKKKITKVI